MARILYRRWEALRNIAFGHGRLLLVSWRKANGLGLSVPVLIQDPPAHGGLPHWPKTIGYPGNWKDAKAFFRRIEQLPEMPQHVLSSMSEQMGFTPFGSMEELEKHIASAEAEANSRWGSSDEEPAEEEFEEYDSDGMEQAETFSDPPTHPCARCGEPVLFSLYCRTCAQEVVREMKEDLGYGRFDEDE